MPELVSKANLDNYIQKDAWPFIIQHDRIDPVVPFQNSVDLAEKLKRAIGVDKVMLETLEDARHAEEKIETHENAAKVLDFLDRWLI